MDEHVLENIISQIEQCFTWAEIGLRGELKDTMDYKAAAILIATYNKLVVLYYLPEYVNDYLKGSVDKEYKKYLERKEM